MEFLWNGIREAFDLWISGDREIIEITLRTLGISIVATVLSLAIGVPIGAMLALKSFPGRRPIVALVNTGMGMPPVVVGLDAAGGDDVAQSPPSYVHSAVLQFHDPHTSQ